MAKNFVDNESFEFDDAKPLDDRVTQLESDVSNQGQAIGTLETDLSQHVNNNNRHLNAGERTYLNEPFVIGHYSGMGGNNREINIGFKPYLVIVYAEGIPLSAFRWEHGSGSWTLKDAFNTAGIAVDGYGSDGLEISANGFKVSNIQKDDAPLDSSYKIDSYSGLNYAGITYTYLAFRAPNANS